MAKKSLVTVEEIKENIVKISEVFSEMATAPDEGLEDLKSRYRTLRKGLNGKLIDFAIGGKLVVDKDGELDGWIARKGPSPEDVATVNGLLTSILVIEAAEDEMIARANITDVPEKAISMKAFEQKIKESGVLTEIINPADVSVLFGLANKVRKNRARWTWILVGIGAIVLIGAGTAVYLCTRNKGSDLDEIDADAPAGELEAPDLDDLDVPDLDNLEVPEELA